MINEINENEHKKQQEKPTGRYVYDKKLKKVVKISDEIVGIKKSSLSSIFGKDNITGSGCCPTGGPC